MIVRLKNINFTKQKYTISINNIDINKMLVSKNVSLGKEDFKYFICYKGSKKVRPLFILLPKMSAYRTIFFSFF